MSLISREWVTCSSCGRRTLKSGYCMWCGNKLVDREFTSVAPAGDQQAQPPKTIAFNYVFKVVFLGDIAVGKTSIIKRYALGQFSPEYFPTFDLTTYSKTLEYPPIKIDLTIWDTAGGLPEEDKVGPVVTGVDVGVLVFEVSRRSSFNNIPIYHQIVEKFNPKAHIQVVGNKLDLGFRQVERSEGEALAAKLGGSYIETSATLGTNIDKLFNRNIMECLKNRLDALKKELEG